jgi:hypothetical protein
MGRALWFAAGTAAGLYASVKARRAAYRLSTPGVVDQVAALGVGLRAFNSDLRTGMQAREAQLVQRLDGELAAVLPHPALERDSSG